MIDLGLNLGRSTPKEGNWGQRTGSQIPKNTSNMEGALAWVNYTMSVPYQTAFTQGLYSPTNRTGVPNAGGERATKPGGPHKLLPYSMATIFLAVALAERGSTR